MVANEGVFSRAWADLKLATTHWWRFRIPAALLTAGFATWAALLRPNAGAEERIALAIGGTFGGALLLGLVAFGFLVVTAPIRQRDEAHAELRRLTRPPADDPAAFAQEFSTWLSAKQAAMPDYPSAVFNPMILMDDAARAKRDAERETVKLKHSQIYREVERQARVEYHDRFRDRALAVLGGSTAAGNPRTIEDFQAVQELLERPVEAEPTKAPPTPAERLRGELRAAQREGKALAGEIASHEAVGNLELLDDLVRRYNAYKGRVADLLATTDLLERRWRDEWLRTDHYAQIGPLTREELDQLAQVIASRMHLIDGILRELEGRQ